MKRMIAAMCMVAAPLMVSVPAANATTSCPGGQYPAGLVDGHPTTAKAGMTGLAVWRDHGGWHLRVSEAGRDRAVLTGSITTDGVIKSVKRHTEARDFTIKLSKRPGTQTVAYRFTNYGGVDGIDFVVPCSSYVRFATSFDHTALPTGKIVVGHDNEHPASNPFKISKASAA